MNSFGPGNWLHVGLLSLIALFAGVGCANYRLEGNVLPTFYNLTISLRGDANNPGTTFDGEVQITLHAVQTDVQHITLHKDDIEIADGAWLYNDTGDLLEDIAQSSLTYDQPTQQLTVHLAQTLTLNRNYTLHFKYIGQVQSGMTGLYSASYVEQQTGQTKWMLLTQLQRINARLVFPCFDEPAFKARFQLHIGRAGGVNATSNTKLIETIDEGNNRFTDHFDVTPPMSTYLLAFMVSEYRARGNISEIAVITRPEDYNKTEFSYNVAKSVLDAYGDLFQHSYKDLGNQILLHATTPRFPHNGMENWGLIIYKDTVLEHEPYYTDGWNDKEHTIRIPAHETSHMWFGNSVTFSWWSYFWLNEAFARYYEYFMAHQLHPEYQLDEQFVVRQLQLIFATDARASTQPLTSPEASIQTPSQIGYKFSSITYAKGASIVRMWRNAMGGANFDTAIRTYLEQHHLGNTEPKDLFTHLKTSWPAVNISLDQFFYDFTEQVGFPTIMVNISWEHSTITLRQRRFLLNPSDGSDANLRYTVPITFATNLSPNFQNLTPYTYFDKSVDFVQLSLPEPIDWIVFNLKQSNYYRVYYEPSLLNRIQVALTKSNHSEIAVENRAAIINDLFNFAYIGMLDFADIFKFLEYMSGEVDYVPWYAAYEGMARVAKRLPTEHLSNFGKYLGDITASVQKSLGVSLRANDTVLDVYNRNKQVAWLCRYQDQNCNSKVREKFESSSEQLSPDYRETFYCAASRSGSYARILEYYANETHPTERELLWRAASCTRDYRTHYQKEILGNANSVSLKMVGLAQLYEQNPDMITQIFLTVTENITQLATALDSWPKTAEALASMSDYFTTRTQQQLFSTFIDENQNLFGSSAETLTEALSNVDKHVSWTVENLGKLIAFLGQRNSAAGLTLVSALLVMTPLLTFLLG
ncbi:membrane alanyl aminopeptidase [Drosophila virilis]|uniref:membrane alanyl aminopeptidase n=1 Tax=Drosophila virilis TaxID=7244 RepID=UPI00017D4AAB|nr:membrane alanyl aminopeptidase-like [Drosophila virilis]